MKYRKGYKYQLAKEERFEVPWLAGYNIALPFIIVVDGWLILKAGYACDGPSRPAIRTKNFMRGAFGHDGLYQLLRAELIPKEFREKADQYLVEVTRIDGMSKTRCKWVLFGVRKFAASAAHPDHVRKVYTAP